MNYIGQSNTWKLQIIFFTTNLDGNKCKAIQVHYLYIYIYKCLTQKNIENDLCQYTFAVHLFFNYLIKLSLSFVVNYLVFIECRNFRFTL